MIRLLTCLCATYLVTGCAYLTTYQADLGSPSTGVSLDAKQRVVLVRGSGETRRVCAEPSPDALSALGASLGASILGENSSTKQIAAALGETSASIGLRTTSIQLMRDAMYRACEAYLSGGITAQEYADLQGHSQTLVVGLLAIEQLTGAVQAQQVAVVSNAAAGGVPDVATEAENLTQAKKATLEQQQLADAATEKRVSAEQAVKSKQGEIDAAKGNAATKPEDLAKLESALSSLNEMASGAAKEEQKQVALLDIQRQAEAIAQQAFDLARTRVRATVSGDAKFSQLTRGSMSEKMASIVATAIENIVKSVVAQSVESQKCVNLMSRPLTDISRSQFETLVSLCEGIADKQKLSNETSRKLLMSPQ